jgi:hypothetical protein
MNQKNHLGKNIEGNVLFLVLIAVALFAGLSYVVTQSSRSGAGNITSEKAQLEISNLLNYVTAVQTGLLKLEFAQDVSAGEIYLNNDIYTRNDGSPLPAVMGTPPDPGRYLFHPSGGGVIAQAFPQIAADCPSCPGGYVKPGDMLIVWIRPQWIGDPAMNDVAITFFGVREDVCRLINKKVGIQGIPQVDYTFTSQIIALNFDGSPYGATPSSTSLGDMTGGSAGIEGKDMWCAEDTALPRYVFTKVIEEH